MSAKSPWNTHAVVGIFYPRHFFAAKITIVSPLSTLYNIEWIAEALSYLERHNFPFQCYFYHLHTTLCYGEGIFLFVYSINHRKCSKTFGRHCKNFFLKLLDRNALNSLNKWVIEGADFNINSKTSFFQHLAVIVPGGFHCLLFSAKFCDDYDVTFWKAL